MKVFRISRLSRPMPNFPATAVGLLRHVYAFVALLLLVSEADRVPGGRGGRGGGHVAPGNNQAITDTVDPVGFLKRLGYLKPVHWASWEPTSEGLEQEGELMFEPEDTAPNLFSDADFDPSEMVEEVDGMGRDGEPTIGVDDEEVREAIRKYQQENNLTVTGQLNEETTSKMNELRCGVPAYTVPQNHTTLPELLAGAANRTNRSSNESSNASEQAPTGGRRRRRSVLERWKDRQQERTKKRGYFPGNYITWRLLGEGYSSQIDPDLQLAVIQQAFRMWSEVIPPIFIPDFSSHIDEVDIVLGFGSGRHLGCPHAFQVSEFAHAFDVMWNGMSSVHLNDAIFFTIDGQPAEGAVSLIRVVVHEIGHAVGMPHQLRDNSIMWPNYNPGIPSFEIGLEDRLAIQAIGYGKCEERFHTAFDWVRPKRDENGYMTGVAYNTFFFFDGRYWMYENSKARCRYGDPHGIRGGWQGVTAREIDGILHVWKRSWDVLFFFAGDYYYQYDSEHEQIYTHDANGRPFPNLISYGFPGIPSNIDTVYFNRTVGFIYFFKGNLVYQYEIEYQRVSAGFPKEISEVFPGLPNDLDVAYYSYYYQTTFFMKGFEYWQVNSATGAIEGPYKINERWHDICNVWMWELDGSS